MAKKKKKQQNFGILIIVIIVCVVLFALYISGVIKLPNIILDETTKANVSTESSQTIVDIKDGDYLKAYFIDVGQADSILIEDCSSGKKTFMLIDAGTSTGHNAKSLVSFLKSKNVDRLKYFILTHPHSDHIAAADDVINEFPIDKVFMPNCSYSTTTWNKVLTALDNHKSIEIEIVDKNDIGDKYTVAKSSFEILWPEEPSKVKENDINEVSIVVRLVYGEKSFMFTGDAEGENELKIVSNNKGKDLTCDVLKAGHHGSSTASYQQFLDFIKPQYVIISCGEGNSYGHPHKEPMERYNKMNMTILRTDLLGTIEMVSDGKNIQVVK